MKPLSVLGFTVALAACGTSGAGTSGRSGGGSAGNPTAGASSGGTTNGESSTTTGGGGGTTSGGSGTTGGCATMLCGGTCCDAGDSCVDGACCPAAQTCGPTCCTADSTCVTDPAGQPLCGVLCEKSADCGGAIPCCRALGDRDGGVASHGVCAPNPPTASSYSCRCLSSSECDAGACVPGVDDAGIITGPYLCAPDDGSSHAGCEAAPSACSAVNQYCSADQEGNAFCSSVCESDAVCGNPGVACCDASCNLDEVCCGLCGG